MNHNTSGDVLRRLRGDLPTRNHTARTVAALAANPGCARRGVLDAAGIDKTELAVRLGSPAHYGQSPFAIVRGHSFEKQVKAGGGSALRELLAEKLGADLATGSYEDLGGEGQSREERVERTKALLATGDCAVLDHPMLPVEVAGHRAYLEPDALACRIGGRLHIVEIKSFAVIDGQADPGKLAAAAGQAAVYVLALQDLARELGLPEDAVATDIVLVCPQGFSNRPTAALIDVRRQLAVTRRRLARMAGVDVLLADLPDGLSFAGKDPVGAVAQVPAAYNPDCLSACELALHCRSEARSCAGGGTVGALGQNVRGALGGIDRIDAALDLAEGRREPDPGEEETARLLRRAEKLRREVLGH